MPRKVYSHPTLERLFSGGVLERARVLVVEDDDDSRELLETFLSAFGMTVRAVASAPSALEVFEREGTDVLVSDIDMPGMSGLDLIAEIRKRAPDAGGLTSAVAITAHSDRDVILTAGFHVHLVKPFDPVRLVEVLRDMIEPGKESRARWTLRDDGGRLLLSMSGHLTKVDTQAIAQALTEAFSSAPEPRPLVLDMRDLTGLDPSVGSTAERSVWSIRKKMAHVTVRGGPALARLVARATCLVLGVPCTLD